MTKAKKEALLEAAGELCDAADELAEEYEVEGDPALIAVLAARLLTRGDREQLRSLSKASNAVLSDGDAARMAAEAEEEDAED